MKANTLLCALLFSSTLAGVPMVAQAADVKSTQESIKGPDTHDKELEVGDKASDKYKREELAVKNWKALGLTAPEEGMQWVKIEGRYVLIEITNGTIKAIQAGK
ncbi:RcnB family protein [Pseudomonas sp.]|uniref:RcnB family protein n=1 Tax=Pseudomonas sp. TaxID=306 RepID=UPI0028AC3E86|nr:RcnB family protein [Pseudomonas sp.]